MSTSHLPLMYEENRLVLLTRDPWWLFAYWDLRHPIGPPDLPRFIRLYRGGLQGPHFDYPLHPMANNYYLRVPAPSSTYIAQLGHIEQGRFVPWLTSNPALTPRAQASDRWDAAWPPLKVGPEIEIESGWGTSPGLWKSGGKHA